jgi:hypothetical protein
MERIIEERRRRREQALRKAREFANCVNTTLGSDVTVVLFGSYARGDFNEWSDIDILVMTNHDLPSNPLTRLDPVIRCITETRAPIEPVVISRSEFTRLISKKNPLALDVLNNGIVLIGNLGLKDTNTS